MEVQRFFDPATGDGSQLDVLLDAGDRIAFGSLEVEALHTPGRRLPRGARRDARSARADPPVAPGEHSRGRSPRREAQRHPVPRDPAERARFGAMTAQRWHSASR
jgi:hypothetical protein